MRDDGRATRACYASSATRRAISRRASSEIHSNTTPKPAPSVIGAPDGRVMVHGAVRRHSTQPTASTGRNDGMSMTMRHARQERQRLGLEERAVHRQIAQRRGEALAGVVASACTRS